MPQSSTATGKRQPGEEASWLKGELEKKSREAEESMNRLKYLQADFENYRKSLDREKEGIIRLANEGLVKDMLPLVDGFETALRSLEEDSRERKGLELLHRKLMGILESHGLKRIESSGKRFDPMLHEAVMKEASGKDTGLILEELQAGFTLNSKVIRPARVKVSENKGGTHG